MMQERPSNSRASFPSATIASSALATTLFMQEKFYRMMWESTTERYCKNNQDRLQSDSFTSDLLPCRSAFADSSAVGAPARILPPVACYRDFRGCAPAA